MSIENTEGLELIAAALDDLRRAYDENARLMSLPPDTPVAMMLTRAEAGMVNQERIAVAKQALQKLGFNKPIVQVTTGGLNAERSKTPTSGVVAAEV